MAGSPRKGERPFVHWKGPASIMRWPAERHIMAWPGVGKASAFVVAQRGRTTLASRPRCRRVPASPPPPKGRVGGPSAWERGRGGILPAQESGWWVGDTHKFAFLAPR